MSFTLCERLGPVQSEKDRFVVKPKNKLPAGVVAEVGTNFSLQEHGQIVHYKIILIGTQSSVVDGMIQKRVELQVAKNLGGKDDQSESEGETSKTKKSATKPSRIIQRRDSSDSDTSLDSDTSSNFSFRPRTNIKLNAILSDIDEEEEKVGTGDEGDENALDLPLESQYQKLNNDDDNSAQSQSLLANDEYYENYLKLEKRLEAMAKKSKSITNSTPQPKITLKTTTVNSSRDKNHSRSHASTSRDNSVRRFPQNVLKAQNNNNNTYTLEEPRTKLALPHTIKQSLTIDKDNTTIERRLSPLPTDDFIEEEHLEKQDSTPNTPEHDNSTPSISVLRSKAYKECRAENVSQKRKISELEEEIKVLRNNNVSSTDDIRQVMNAIVKPMADQISNILSILKKANPLYARDYDEEHDGEIFVGNGLYIPCLEYNVINFGDPLKAAQDLAVCLFGKQTLATHSVSGRASNAHLQTKIAKPQLGKDKMAVIIEHIKTKYQEIKGNLSFYDSHTKCARDLLDTDITRAIANKCSSLSRPAATAIDRNPNQD